MTRLTIAHFSTVPGFSARPGFCRKGGRLWFKRHGLDWSDFVANGIDAEAVRPIADAFVLAVIAHAERTEGAARE